MENLLLKLLFSEFQFQRTGCEPPFDVLTLPESRCMITVYGSNNDFYSERPGDN
jgi:hypothetical protein